MSNKPSVGLLVEPISQNGLKMAKINYFSNEIQLSLNHTQSEIFEILVVDKQMFISCGQDEPLRSPQKAYFICVIGIYFVSFFYEHPVLTSNTIRPFFKVKFYLIDKNNCWPETFGVYVWHLNINLFFVC